MYKRILLWVGLSPLLGLLVSSPAPAQSVAKVKLDKLQVGFDYVDRGGFALSCFKPGFWTPVYLTLVPFQEGDKEGLIRLPTRKDGSVYGTLSLAVNDGDDVEASYTIPFAFDPTRKTTLVSYVKPGNMSPEIRITFKDEKGRKATDFPKRLVDQQGLYPGYQMYLTLGARISEFQDAVEKMPKGQARSVGHETQVERLPDNWFGYEGVDLSILTTSNQAFFDELIGSKKSAKARVKALAEWVRHGGRLVITMSPKNQDAVYRLLQSPYWRAPLEKYLSKDEQNQVSLSDLHAKIGSNKRFPRLGQPLQVPKLLPGRSAEVFLTEGRDIPLMIRVPCGLGQVTLLALEPDQAPFSRWEGRETFWGNYLVQKLAPPLRNAGDFKGEGINNPGMVGFDGNTGNDVTSKLHRELEDFNVPIIPFGWVVLFIFIYILIVGPLDYLILKKVFKRLEWTWITFPAVVLIISVLAYFTAYAMKGNDLKINKVDLVEIDLRSDLDENNQTQKAALYGNTWFSILSPRIQNYTIGIQPVPEVWNTGLNKNQLSTDVTMSWMGRPEPSGPGSFGRPRSTSLFKSNYAYAPDAKGILGVPIPVWTTKTFQATWEVTKMPAQQAPLTADLYYNGNDPNQSLKGTLQNHLPMDLIDVRLIYGGDSYNWDESLPGKNSGGQAISIEKKLKNPTQLENSMRIVGQSNSYGTQPSDGEFYTDNIIQALYFHSKTQSLSSSSNTVLGHLDQSWRIQDLDPRNTNNPKVHTAILIARLPRAEGGAEKLTADNDPRLPTHLWLGKLPEEGEERPALSGTLSQITYIRVYIPVRPK